MALHLSGRHKCRMCNARLVSAETVERPRLERGGHILYKGVRRLSCPNGCPVSLYDFSKATVIGPAPTRTAPILPPEPPKPNDDEKPKKPKRAAKEGAKSVDEKKDAKSEAKSEAKDASTDEVTKTDEAQGENAESAQPLASGEAAGESAPAQAEASSEADEEAETEQSAASVAAAAVTTHPQPKSRVPAILGRIYMIVGFAFAYFLFIMTIVLADVTPAVKLSYFLVLGGVAVLNALAFFMPNRSHDEQEV